MQAENQALRERLDINTTSSSPSTIVKESPSLPNSPHYLYNSLSKSVSLPSSPIHHNTTQHNVPPPLNLPPPQSILSNSTTSSTVSTPTSTPPQQAHAPPSQQPALAPHYAPPPSFYIPQPPTLYNYPPMQQQQQQNLRPLLPATSKSSSTQFLPSVRMSGYEKIYGNVCRY